MTFENEEELVEFENEDEEDLDDSEDDDKTDFMILSLRN